MIGNRTLAVPGPTNMPPRIASAMAVPLEDHRAPDMADFILPLLADLKQIFRTQTELFWCSRDRAQVDGKLPCATRLMLVIVFLERPLASSPCCGWTCAVSLD